MYGGKTISPQERNGQLQSLLAARAFLNRHPGNPALASHRKRLEHAVVTGLLNRMIEARASAVVANSEIAYVRELRPYQRFMVHTRILGWDDKYTYYDQRFDSQRKLHTHALLRLRTCTAAKPSAPRRSRR